MTQMKSSENQTTPAREYPLWVYQDSEQFWFVNPRLQDRPEPTSPSKAAEPASPSKVANCKVKLQFSSATAPGEDMKPSVPKMPAASPVRGGLKTLRTCKSQPLRSPKAKAKAQLAMPRIEPPHPNELLSPGLDTVVQGYYTITVGQEVGVFYTWPEVQARTMGVSGNTQARYDSFNEALQVYGDAYEQGNVLVRPLPNGPFDKGKQVIRDSSTHSPNARAGQSSRGCVVNLCSSNEESEGEEIARLTLSLSLMVKEVN
ncbi:hypothetical protein Hypma_004694 [Hypsizygus marmoreus]|uniref:Ribonuclease H1 N-terminal domain-containing protein n=1 Tax=Hypsizygus marmoreus TaxID=39966 RepID=A0A369J8U4_HYPMA|nr:hypothetical protein Hypma_004694 [Hypsizygus marmoreus]